MNDSGAHILARNMNTTPEFISKQPTGSFAISIRNSPAVSVKITPFVMEKMPRMTAGEMSKLRDKMRDKYSAPPPSDEPAPQETPEPAVDHVARAANIPGDMLRYS